MQTHVWPISYSCDTMLYPSPELCTQAITHTMIPLMWTSPSRRGRTVAQDANKELERSVNKFTRLDARYALPHIMETAGKERRGGRFGSVSIETERSCASACGGESRGQRQLPTNRICLTTFSKIFLTCLHQTHPNMTH